MTVIVSLLGTFSTASLLALFFILSKLSERFGSVVKMKPFYKGYYVGFVFLGVGLLTHLLIAGANLKPDDVPAIIHNSWFLLIAYHLPLAIGVTIGLIVTWRYWSWLVTEKNI
jgi:hypothetical protein